MKFLELLRAYTANEEPQDNPRLSMDHLAMPLVFAGLLVVLSGCMAPSAVQRHDVNVMWKDEAPKAAVPQPDGVRVFHHGDELPPELQPLSVEEFKKLQEQLRNLKAPKIVEGVDEYGNTTLQYADGRTPAGIHDGRIHSEPTPAEPLISIVGPTERAVGEMVVLTAKGESKGWSWTCAGKHAFETADGGQRLFFCTPKPGEYEFILAGYPPEAVKPEQVSHFVTIRGGVPPQPTPEPEPTPTPPVPPPPHVSKAYVLIVYESKSVTPEQSRVYTNLRDGPAAKYLKDKGHMLDIVDQNKHPATKFAPFKSLPEMLVLPLEGLPLEGRYEAAPVWRGPMPATADGVVEQIKRVGG